MNYDTEKYKVWKFPNLMLLHWVINPALAFNEIILGQRMPKVILIDKISDAPLFQRSYIPCPACGTIHDGRLWGKGNAFGHWLGLICPSCKNKIPCLWNLTSLILLVALAPIWMPLKYFFGKRYVAYELTRYPKNMDSVNVPFSKMLWIKMGLFFGLFMFLFMAVTEYLKGNLYLESLGILAVICLIGGLCFGAIMWVSLGRARK